MSYDPNNIFARIIRGEIPCKKLFESQHVLAFHDIRPQAPVHVLVVPKGAYVTQSDFADKASEAEQAAVIKAIGEVARLTGVTESGYRVIANNGGHGHQEVPHLHYHVLGGRPLGRMLEKSDR
jgi:diadenosine tetraphosphate (Ap4A) HIT family hydrolase